MKKLATAFLVLAALALAASSAFAANAVRISQVYGGGGGSSGTYIYDYVELFNSSGSPVSIAGWSIQYGSATGSSFGSTASNMYVFPTGAVIQPCSYVYVQCGSAGSGGVAFPVTPDFTTSTINISATTGKVALVNNATGNNACSGNTSGPIYVDVVGFGSANCFETAVSAVLSNTSSATRKNNGMQDTDNNANDFLVNTNPVPRNAQTPANPDCLITPVENTTWGRMKSIYR